MKTDAYVVLVSGAGQLGSRYLQGLARSHLPLRIFVQDSSPESLARARLRWEEVRGRDPIHNVSYHADVGALPREIDVAIVSTTADVRPRAVSEIAGHAAVRFWVLEKVLAQSQSDIDEIVSSVGSNSGAWVNTPRRVMPWHRQIKSQLGLATPITLRVEGGAWGLACNAIHFLDMLAWWSGETLQTVSTERLATDWFASKRSGIREIAGTLEAKFSGGSSASLSADDSAEPVHAEVTDGQRTWLINEGDGSAVRNDGLALAGRLAYQSELTAPLIESILQGNGCELPTLEESAAMHRVFIDGMLRHWRRTGDASAFTVPIT
jgi:hypothetical protein